MFTIKSCSQGLVRFFLIGFQQVESVILVSRWCIFKCAHFKLVWALTSSTIMGSKVLLSTNIS